MDKNTLKSYSLFDMLLFDEQLISMLREHVGNENLVSVPISDAVGIAFESGVYVVYMNNELGQREFEKRYKYFKCALKFARQRYSDLCFMLDRIERNQE